MPAAVWAQGSVHHASHHQTGEGGWRGIPRTYLPNDRGGYLASSVMVGGTLKSTLILPPSE